MSKHWLNAIFVLTVLLVMVSLVSAHHQEPSVDGSVPIPTDIKIWGGISLALIFNRGIVPLLIFTGVIKEQNKKLIAVVLLFLGAAVGGVYSILTLKLSEPFDILTNVVSGALAGLMAVGVQSTVKNTFQYFGKTELPKLLSNPKML